MSKPFSIGCDPEFFIREDGKWVASHKFIEGDKANPQPLGRGNGVMVDNVALEFCTTPALKEKKFVQSIRQALQAIQNILPTNVEIIATPSAHFPKEELTDPVCRQFGCDPDFNAWDHGVQNPKPKQKDIKNLRSAGGHVHVGHASLKAKEDKLTFIRLMDCMHGLVSVTLDRSQSAQNRRKLYGKAGCFRPTDYGVEYRTMSNFWCKHPDLVRLVYRLTRDAVNLFTKGFAGKILDNVSGEMIQDAINNGNVSLALDILAAHVMPHISKDTASLYQECAGKIYSSKANWSNIT